MDWLVGYDALAELPDTDRLPKSGLETMGEQLKTLHARYLVHGDIRDTNILVKNDNRTQLMFIDFEWAGVEDVVRYPPYVNYTDIERPNDARRRTIQQGSSRSRNAGDHRSCMGREVVVPCVRCHNVNKN